MSGNRRAERGLKLKRVELSTSLIIYAVSFLGNNLYGQFSNGCSVKPVSCGSCKVNIVAVAKRLYDKGSVCHKQQPVVV